MQQYRQLWESIVDALTEAALMVRPGKEGHRLDFGEFMATALATTAANVGSANRLVAGRPGSGEPGHVFNFVCAAGIDPDRPVEEWAHLRTKPVELMLNVEGLVADQRLPAGGGATDFRPGSGRAVSRHRRGTGHASTRLQDEADEAEWEAYEKAQVELAAKQEAAERDLMTRYGSAYQVYARKFEEAVHARAEAIGLRAPVTVHVDASPVAEKWDQNPSEWGDHDPVAWHLWDSARQAVGLPTVEATPTAKE